MDGIATIQLALKQYQSHIEASKKYYDKKMGPKELRRPRGRPRKGTGAGVGSKLNNSEGVAEAPCVQTA